MLKKVFCIIVTYNGMKWIEQCLRSLYRSSYPVEIFVIDNNSKDGTADFVERIFPNVVLIKQATNIGFGQANNIGIQKALKNYADYVFLLNQDTRIKEDTIAELVKAAIANPRFGIISPFHLDNSETNFERVFLDLFNRYNSEMISDLFFKRLKPIYETHYIHAASWLVSAECLLTTGGFDPLYFHYGEDDDYLQRVTYFKFKIGLVPTALIVHDATFSTWEKLEWDENRNSIIGFQLLKKMSPHFRTNLLVYLKSVFDELTTLIIYRKFKKFRFRFRILINTLFKLRKIHSSYKKSFIKGAFLR